MFNIVISSLTKKINKWNGKLSSLMQKIKVVLSRLEKLIEIMNWIYSIYIWTSILVIENYIFIFIYIYIFNYIYKKAYIDPSLKKSKQKQGTNNKINLHNLKIL